MFVETNKLRMKNVLSILRRTLMQQRLSKILCSVFKLVNNKTNPESLNELISLRETKYALRGKDISLRSTQHALDSIPILSGAQGLEQLAYIVIASSDFKTFKNLLENESLIQYRRFST